jgi:colanic acid/amylovoran biosynthesis glycosyltransferase
MAIWRIPVALMEAMAVGIPVVSTVHSGIPELIKSDHSGWLVPENNAPALADRLAALAISTSRRWSLCCTMPDKKLADFNQQVINRQLASLLQTL